jgi:hypothetical protein
LKLISKVAEFSEFSQETVSKLNYKRVFQSNVQEFLWKKSKKMLYFINKKEGVAGRPAPIHIF